MIVQNDNEHYDECRVNYATGLMEGVRHGWHSISPEHKLRILTSARDIIDTVLKSLQPKPLVEIKGKGEKS